MTSPKLGPAVSTDSSSSFGFSLSSSSSSSGLPARTAYSGGSSLESVDLRSSGGRKERHVSGTSPDAPSSGCCRETILITAMVIALLSLAVFITSLVSHIHNYQFWGLADSLKEIMVASGILTVVSTAITIAIYRKSTSAPRTIPLLRSNPTVDAARARLRALRDSAPSVPSYGSFDTTTLERSSRTGILSTPPPHFTGGGVMTERDIPVYSGGRVRTDKDLPV